MIAIILSLISGLIMYQLNNRNDSRFRMIDFIIYSIISYIIIGLTVELLTGSGFSEN
jgi:hypothetical protein